MTGFSEFAFEYVKRGWTPLPLPHAEKSPPPKDYTGINGIKPSGADIQEWIEARPNGNIGLHLRDRVVGIDVDNYKHKTGFATFIEAEKRWGALPATVISTSRVDWKSGIRFYRLPDTLSDTYELETILDIPGVGSDIEILQKKHRYAVAYPSIHPDTNGPYRWYNNTWELVDIPWVKDLPLLPERWISELTARQSAEIVEHGDPDSFVSNLPQGPMTEPVYNCLTQALKELDTAPGARHDAATKSVLRLLRLADDGETGVSEALVRLGSAFIEATADRNTEVEAKLEFRRMVYGTRGHDLIASTPSDKKVQREMFGDMAVPSVITPAAAPLAESAEVDLETILGDLGAIEMYDGAEGSDAPVARAPMTERDRMEWILENPDAPLPSTEVAVETQQERADRSTLPFYQRLYDADALGSIPLAEPLIKGLLYKDTLAQIAGDPGSYKSFLTLGMACAIAAPSTKFGTRMWEGWLVENRGPVIYVAAEGLSGMRVRTLAWCKDQNVNIADLELKFFPESFDLGSYSHVEQVIDMVQRVRPVLLVLDTRARLTGDLKENDATDQGKAITNLDRIRNAVGCTILAVHHSAKGGQAGRGSGAWDGAVWTELRSARTADMKLKIHCEKHKDVESGCDHFFQLAKVEVPEALMPGVPEPLRTTLVVHQEDMRPGMTPGETPEVEDKYVKLIRELDQGGGLKLAEVYRAAQDLDYSEHRTTVGRLLKKLLDQGKLVNKRPDLANASYGAP